ncbi:class I adenylate-forming enzyme family protein [Paraburkholderia tuberum]|uniref:Acyl-CoA synthetase (AMP-forming)/AMP-acid ligase II n=1 Tax=Paraburkholderia tuberum TaxID=157910 RepID=A0A1H1KIM3_9BURK|nr:class I adenylate-forming enzyme family protein [Paraburkholderia tuberum]SDR61619.1 Acyl-CoA synthetase (AMP-forming)/AMP-acid ligase II [Paraburkholderia tuberum]
MQSFKPANDVAQIAARYGDRVAVIDTRGRVTYKDLIAKASGIATQLRSFQLGADETIATLFRNGSDAVAAGYAVMMAGFAEAPINPALSKNELEHCLAVSEAKLVLTSADLVERFAEFKGPVVEVDSIGPKTFDPADYPQVEPAAAARVVFTSGTSGPPKGALHTQEGRWIANLLLRANLPHQPSESGPVLLMTPFSHGASLLAYAYLSSGGSVVLMDGVNTPQVLEMFERGDCAAAFMPPTVLAKVVDAAEGRRFAAVKSIFCGTAILSPHLYRRAREVFGPVIRITYGKSELFNPITVMESAETDHWYQEEGLAVCVGWPAAGVEVAIRDDDANVLPDGEVGTVHVRAHHLMSGYRTRDGFMPMSQGEYHDTGDLGFIDAKGRLRLVGRAADMIKTGGYKVAPDEVERALAGSVGNSEIAVVGIPSEYWGEVILAAVESPPPNWREQMRAVAESMTSYKRPRLLVPFERLPRNAQGKIVRRAIKDAILAQYHLIDGPRPELKEAEGLSG